MTGDRIVRERIRIVALIVMAIDGVEETAHRLAQSVIEEQGGVGLRPTDRWRLLEPRRAPTVVDAVWEPGRFREEAGAVGLVGAV